MLYIAQKYVYKYGTYFSSFYYSIGENGGQGFTHKLCSANPVKAD